MPTALCVGAGQRPRLCSWPILAAPPLHLHRCSGQTDRISAWRRHVLRSLASIIVSKPENLAVNARWSSCGNRRRYSVSRFVVSAPPINSAWQARPTMRPLTTGMARVTPSPMSTTMPSLQPVRTVCHGYQHSTSPQVVWAPRISYREIVALRQRHPSHGQSARPLLLW